MMKLLDKGISKYAILQNNVRRSKLINTLLLTEFRFQQNQIEYKISARFLLIIPGILSGNISVEYGIHTLKL